MIACPNTNTKEWKALQKALGQKRASLAYLRANKGAKELRIPTVEEGKELIKGNQTVEQSILKELQHYGMVSKRQYKTPLAKFRGKVLFSIPKIRTVSDIKEYIGLESNAVLFKRNKGAINNLRDFNMSWFTMERTENADFIVIDEDIYLGKRTIDVEPFDVNDTEVDDGDYMNYLQWWHTLSMDQKKSENALRAQEGLDELPLSEPERYQKVSFIDDKEVMSVTEAKIKRMTDVLASKGIDVEVRLDPNLDEKGKFIKENGNNVIILNPNKISSDTAIHEFAHVFIEYLGLDNQRVRAAIEKLRLTKLWADLKEIYSNLSDEEFEKEVLATAIGLEGAELFQNKEEASAWQRFKDWFFNIVSKKLGLPNFAVKQLTKELIGLTDYETKPDELTYHAIDFSSEINNLNDAMSFIIGDLRRRYNVLKNVNNPDNKYMKNLLDLRKKMEEYYDSYDASLVLNYTSSALRQLKAANKRVDTLFKNKEDAVKDHKTLHMIKTYIEGYRVIGELAKVTKNVNLTPSVREELNKAIDESARLFSELDNKLKEKSIDSAASALAEHSTIGYAKLREKFEIEANQRFENKQKEEKENYINKRLSESEDEAREIALNHFKQILRFTPQDITAASKWVNDPQSTGSQTINMVTKMIDYKDAKVRSYFLNERSRIHKLVKEYKKKTGKKDFKHLIITDSKGVKYLRNGYNPEFYRLHDELENKIFELQKEFYSSMEKYGTRDKRTESINKKIEEAKNELKKFLKENTKNEGKNIADKWKDTTVLTEEDKKILKEFNDNFIKHDKGLPKDKKLSINVKNETFVRLPSITKNKWETENIAEAAKLGWEKAVHIQADEEELGQLPEDLSQFRRMGAEVVETDIDFIEKKAVPVHFRGKINPKVQSDDIPSMIMMNIMTTENYREKYDLEPTIFTITDATANKRVGIIDGLGKTFKVSSKDLSRQLDMQGKDSNEYQALISTINVRMYGKHLKNMGDIPFLGSGEKAIKNLESVTSDLLLGFNYMANIVNIFQGKTMQIIEMISDGNFKGKDFLKAEDDFRKDFFNLISDFGTIDKNSTTWQMIETLGLFGQDGLKTKFSEESWVKQLMSKDTLHIGQNVGELYIHGTLAYMIMRGHKVMNAKRQWIDKNGNVVENKSQAANLRDMMFFEDGQMKFKHAVYSTISNTRLDSLQGITDIASKIKSLSADMFGQYDASMKSMAQTYWWGRLGFALRKWMVRGFNRRWRGFYTLARGEQKDTDRVFNEATQEFEEGMYTGWFKWVRLLIQSGEGLKGLVNMHTRNRVWNSLTNNEKRNIIRTRVELTMSLMTFVVYQMASKAAEDEDDELLYHVAYAHRRLLSELTFFLNPAETMKILRSPFAAMSTITRVGQVTTQAMEDLFNLEMEKYEQGVRKGNYKLFEKLKNATPALNYIDDPFRMQEKLRYMTGIKSY